MLAAYIASSDLLVQQRDALGDDHPEIENTAKTEVAHLTAIFRRAAPCRTDVTQLMAYVHRDTVRSFSEAQRKSLMAVASVRLSTTVVTDGVVYMQPDLYAAQKLQTHLYSYNYYSADQWAFWYSTATMIEKYKEMSRIWISWGLLHPSGPTFRVGLATLIAASGEVATSTSAFKQMETFKIEFKAIRGSRPPLGTLKTFPRHASSFVILHPNRLPSYVDCRVDEHVITEHACKEHIPIKSNNARLLRKTTPVEAGSAADAAPHGLTVANVLQYVLGRSSSSSPPPARRRSQSPIDNGRELHRRIPPLGDAPTPRSDEPAPLARGGVDDGVASSPVAKAIQQVEHAAAAAPVVDAGGDPTGKVARREKLDHVDALLASYRIAKSAMTKKPAGANKRRKKAAEEESEDESEDENADEEEASIDEKAPPKARVSAASKDKAKAAAAKKAAAASTHIEPPPTIAKRPSGVKPLRSSEFPRVDPDASVYWGGGRVYKAKGNLVRVYARKEDRSDKRFAFTDKASLNAAWIKACRVIVDDPRPVA